MLADATGADCDRAGRVAVQPDCSLPGHPEVFAIGDMAALDGLPGRRRGGHAAGDPRLEDDQAASRRARTSAPFRYRDLGSMAMVSRFRAVVSFKGIRVAGFLGWLMWLFVHLRS